MHNHSLPQASRRYCLGGLAVAIVVGVSLVGYGPAASADTGPYYVTYPGYCNVKQLYVDNQGSVYGKEVGCEVSVGEPLVGTFSSDGVHVGRTDRQSGMPCVETYWYDGTLSGACSDGNYIFYEPTLLYGPRAQAMPRTPGKPASPPRITWKLEQHMPDLNTLRSLPSMSR